MPAEKKLRIRPRINYKYEAKTGYQMLLEIRNIEFLPKKEIRISVKDEKGKIIHLKKGQLKRGTVINHHSELFLNKYLKKLIHKTEVVLYFLRAIKTEINKKNIEEYLYDPAKYSDADDFYYYVEDEESAEIFFEDYDKTPEQFKLEEKEERNRDFKLGIYKPQLLIEILNMYNPPKVDKRLKSILEFYCESIGHDDIHYSNFSKDLIDRIIRFCINTGYKEGDRVLRYSYYTIKRIAKKLKAFGKYLEEELKLKVNTDYKDFSLKVGRKDGHIKYKFSTLTNVFTIYHDEFKLIENADFSKVKDMSLRDLYEKTRINFLAQTYAGGLRISEYKEITKESFIKLNGELYLSSFSTKTGKVIQLPISKKFKELLESVDYNLPIFNNDQHYNESLKLMANVIGLNREILLYEDYAHYQRPKPYKKKLHELFTSKLARKALVSILYNQGYSTDKIRVITGHSSNEILQYIKMEEENKKTILNQI